MNGKYYGQREIRWHSREKDRLEHIKNKREMRFNHEKGSTELQQKQPVAVALGKA
jgi:hypothetical protein